MFADRIAAEPETELTPFSAPDAVATPWAEARKRLETADLFWCTTVRPDGRPHVTPLLATPTLGGLCFATGGNERKGRNLDANPHCLLITGESTMTGTDVVVEGPAALVESTEDRRRAMADVEAKYGEHLGRDGTWHFMSAGVIAGDIRLYRLEPTVAFARTNGSVFSETRYRW